MVIIQYCVVMRTDVILRQRYEYLLKVYLFRWILNNLIYKTMKKVGLTLVIALFLAAIFPLQAQVKLELEATVGQNDAVPFYDTDKVQNIIVGVRTGLLLNVKFQSGFGLESGLLLSTKGYFYGYDHSRVGKQLTGKHYRYGTLEYPLYVTYKYDLGKVKLVWKAGGYASNSLWGRSRELWTLYENNSEVDYSFRNYHSLAIGNISSDDLRSFDVGLHFATGVEIGRFTAGIGYSIGLVDVLPNLSGKNTNRILNISVGYKFF